MTNSFMSAPSTMFTSESVTEGHPDKLCDQVSDAVLDAILREDPDARVACETATTTGTIIVFGEITTTAYVDIERIVRDTVRRIGYTGSSIGFDADTCGVLTSIKEQSPDIAQGVNRALEARDRHGEVEAYDLVGAGDQGMMIGFACNETDDYMPLTLSLAHALTRRLAELRHNNTLPYLRPDGKSQVTVEYAYGAPSRIEAVVVSTQHAPEVGDDVLRRDVEQLVVRHVCPPELLQDTKIFVNPTGRFVIGGPMGDAGLTGRKIIVDTYGGVARHGGGAFSGKDPSKVDRSAAYAARHLAKNVVAAGLADRFEVQVSYAIGVSHPTSIAFETFGTARIDEADLGRLIHKHFDLRPAAIVDRFQLRRPIYLQTAAYGHFGRPDLDLPWEALDVADALRREAGISVVKSDHAS
ncbi:MAG: methionine adenosyltransferase [Chloroflexi bacterium]|nr:methionine adenosyltransferase [Chloroflexota bacterium]MDA1003730.1 methionine adenosyltransferase [Chloroflexota bacterium]